MQVKNFSAYKDVPVQVKVTKDRFYEYKQIVPLNRDTTLSVALTPFEGLDYSVVASDSDSVASRTYSIETQGKQLWNMQEYTGASHAIAPIGNKYLIANRTLKGCLDDTIPSIISGEELFAFVKPEGDLLLSKSNDDKEDYIWANRVRIDPRIDTSDPEVAHFDIVGTGVTVADDVATGFNETSWIETDATMPNTAYFSMESLRLISRIVCPSDAGANQGLWYLGTTNSYITWIGMRSHDATIWSNGFSDGQADIFNGKAGVSFWMQTIIDSTGIKVYVIESDATSFEELPTDLSQWQLNVQKSEDIHTKIKNIWLGRAATSEYWRGDIDLRNTRVDGAGPVDASGEKTWSLIWSALS